MIVNPVSPTSHQCQFSPISIHTQCSQENNDENYQNDHPRKNALILYEFSTNIFKKCMEMSLEDFYVDIGA